MEFGYILILGGIVFLMYSAKRKSSDANASVFDAFDTSRGIGGSSSVIDSLKKKSSL